MKLLKKLLKPLAFVVAFPVTLVVLGVLFLQGCKRNQVCDPVIPNPQGTNTPGTPGKKAGPTNTLPPTNVPVREPIPDMICDPVHVPPPPPPPRK